MVQQGCKDEQHCKDLQTRYQTLMDAAKEKILTKIHSTEQKEAIVEESNLDNDLALFVVLKESTPKGLAELATSIGDGGGGTSHQELVDKLLANGDLMKEMVLADGAKGGQYGMAMKIYDEIQRERTENCIESDSDDYPLDETKRSAPVLDRLALAIALEHAVPLPQDHPEADANARANEAMVDPVQRYLNYELAFLRGELDADFPHLSVWLLRMVVDGDEPDAIAAWGRTMLRNYRPDHVLCTDPAWRYVNLVRTNVRYGSHHVKYDRKELQRYQNILMNGGICGRRAFIGRFILRAFGIPTTARPSKAHGALCHWTRSKGWVVNLGPDWGNGWTKGVYGKDVDFLASCRARDHTDDYWKVKRAQWIGDIMGEKRVYGKHDTKSKHDFWYALSLRIQDGIVDAAKPESGLCEAQVYQPTIAQRISMVPSASEDKKIHCNDANLVVPAIAFAGKLQNDVQVMKSFNGGSQLYLSPLAAKGLTVLRGGTWKTGASAGCDSGSRLKSGGYGKYSDWGFRVALSAEHCNAKPDKNGKLPMTLTIELPDDENSSVLELVYIEPGCFVMGGANTHDDRFACVEVPKHRVEITHAYYIGKYPVTQAQYKAIIGKNPSGSTKDPNCPVDSIGEEEAHAFCREFDDATSFCIRLPTEAEWEYAVRAGTETKWFFGDDPDALGDYAWFKDNAGGKSHPVGEKKPNPFGLYDVYGNVCERISDKYAPDFYEKGPVQDPSGPNPGTSSSIHYTITVATEGQYSLVAEVCTMNAGQQMTLSVNGSTTTDIELPFTCGDWGWSESVQINLKQGDSELKFFRANPPQFGVALSRFRLTGNNLNESRIVLGFDSLALFPQDVLDPTMNHFIRGYERKIAQHHVDHSPDCIPCVPSNPYNEVRSMAEEEEPKQKKAKTMTTIAKGVEFDTIAREWRCKWSMQDDRSSLVKTQEALNSILEDVKGVDGVKEVQRVVCGGCLDFKVITSLSEEAYAAWKEKDHAPEAEFLEKLKKIDGVTAVETQTYTLMPM